MSGPESLKVRQYPDIYYSQFDNGGGSNDFPYSKGMNPNDTDYIFREAVRRATGKNPEIVFKTDESPYRDIYDRW